MNKILVLLPDKNDLAQSSKLDKDQYEVHILHAIDEAPYSNMSPSDYLSFLAQPEYLISYVEKAVSYVKDHEITAIMYSHDMASIVASVVCERTGLQGPPLEATFCCLHKYYARVKDASDIWFDFICFDQPEDNWKVKVHYPCFLKAPFLHSSKGLCIIRNEKEMSVGLAKLKKMLSPFFPGYCNFFKKYLDLEKFPLAVENIALVEDFIEDGIEYCIDGWIDEAGEFTMYCIGETFFSQSRNDIVLAYVLPQFTLDKFAVEKMNAFSDKISKRFGLRNTFVCIECWKRGDDVTLIEVNGRIPTPMSEAYRNIFQVSIYETAVHLACGEMKTLRVRRLSPANTCSDSSTISGWFTVSTLGEGKGKQLIDYKYARYGCIKDGVYNNTGAGLLLKVDENSVVKQTPNGATLCSFLLSDTNHTCLFRRAEKIMKNIVLRTEDMNIIQFQL